VGIVLTAAAASVAVAALGLPMLTADDHTTGQGGPDGSAAPAITSPSAKPLTAGQVLLVAAVTEEQAGAPTGRYFGVRTLSHSYLTVGTGASAYKLDRRWVIERWTGAKGEKSWFGSRDLGAHPATAADEAKWRRAGSPSRWDLGPADSASGDHVFVSSVPAKGSVTSLVFPGDQYFVGARDAVTSAEIRALPTEPAALRAYLLRVVDAGPGAGEINRSLVYAASGLIFNTPAPPKVRGAALRLLASLPGAHLDEGATDLQGRRGVAVSFDFAQKGTLRLIIDPKTGKVLGESHRGGKDGDTTVLAWGWTNEQPRIPSAMPR
jgi:hypothetical protein